MKSQNPFPTLLLPIFHLFNLCIFLVILSSLLPRKAEAVVDPYFQACSAEPETCGDGQPIKFPFHIPGKQNKSCGYPGFELSCNKNGQPTINIQKNDYIIHNISYGTQILRISNNDFLNSSTGCIPSTQNISFPSDRFELASSQTYVNLLYGCNSSVLESTSRFSFPGCDDHGRENKNSSVLVLPGSDPKLSNISKACTTRMLAPVEPYDQRENGDGIERILRNGFLVKWKASECSICQESGGMCGFIYSEWHFKCFCPDRPHALRCISDKKERKWVIPILAVGWPVLLISCLGLTIWSYYKKKHASSNLLARAITSSKSDLEGGSVYFGVPLYSYNELQEATNNFDIEKELGDGGFGTVYYGKLRDGREVAVKRLYEHNYKRVEQFMNEVEILTRLHHTNLVSLYGCTSRHSRELLLVYEYIPNGTVADHIHGDRATPGSLTWPTRMSIAIETASALAYLHASDIIHRDVKTNNILLDNNFRVKVADFGLSRLFPTDVTHVSTAPQGTPGYVDPEYHQCYQLTSKSDVYSFGVVLMELISSQPAVDIGRHRHEINLANLAINKIEKCAFHDLIDPHLGFQSDDEVKRMTISVASLAFQCLQQDKELRPPMDEVLKALCNIQSCKDVPKDKEKAYEDAGMLNVEPQTSLDCDEVGLLKTKQLPRSPNSVTDNWTSRSTTPSCKDVARDQDKAYEDAGMLKVDPQTSPDCDEIGLLKTKQLTRSPNSVTDNWTSRSTTPNGSN